MSMNIKRQSLNFSITDSDNLSTTNNDTVVEIPTDKIIEIDKQDFKIHQDTVDRIAESIKISGQLEPCVVTPHSKEGYYELLAGRHRKRACEKAGLENAKCIIKQNLSDDDKELIIIDSNTERNNDYDPSELAFAFKHKYEILSRRTNKAIKQIADEGNLSRKKVYRYIRLTYLIKPLLNRVDSGNIPIIAAVELSYLNEKQQNDIFTYLINHATECRITTDNAKLLKLYPADYSDILSGNFNPDEDISFSDDFGKKVDNLSTIEDNNAKDTIPNEAPVPSHIDVVTDNEDNDFEPEIPTEEKTTVSKPVKSPDTENLDNLSKLSIKDKTYNVTLSLTADEITKLGLTSDCSSSDIENAIKDLINNL